MMLVTGFEPWGGIRFNPSGAIAEHLGGEILPVDYDRAGSSLKRLLRRRPDGIVMFGLAETRRRIDVECIALNVDHAGPGPWKRGPRRIRRGPMALASRLPVSAIVARLRRAGIPAGLSHHAGTFVCNHVFYLALASTRVPCGFIHVPPTRAVSLKRQLEGARRIVEAVRKARQ